MLSLSYKRHRFPPEIIAYAVWLYYRFALSFRDVEELLASKGVVVSYEAVRLWCGKFGPDFVRKLRAHRKRLGRRWFVDEVFIRINGTLHCLWRAVDHNGVVVDILVQAKRDRVAAERFFRYLSIVQEQRQTPWSPIGFVAIPPRFRVYCPKSDTSADTGSIIVPKTPISQPVNESAACAGSNHPSRRNSSFRFTASWARISDRDAIGSGAPYRAVRRQRFQQWNAAVQACALEIA